LSLKINNNDLSQLLADTDDEDTPFETSHSSLSLSKRSTKVFGKQKADSVKDDFNFHSEISSPFENGSPGYTHPINQNKRFDLLNFDEESYDSMRIPPIKSFYQAPVLSNDLS